MGAMQGKSEQQRLEELNRISKSPEGRRQLEDILRRHLGLNQDDELPAEDREPAGDETMTADSGIVWEIMKHEYGR